MPLTNLEGEKAGFHNNGLDLNNDIFPYCIFCEAAHSILLKVLFARPGIQFQYPRFWCFHSGETQRDKGLEPTVFGVQTGTSQP